MNPRRFSWPGAARQLIRHEPSPRCRCENETCVRRGTRFSERATTMLIVRPGWNAGAGGKSSHPTVSGPSRRAHLKVRGLTVTRTPRSPPSPQSGTLRAASGRRELQSGLLGQEARAPTPWGQGRCRRAHSPLNGREAGLVLGWPTRRRATALSASRSPLGSSCETGRPGQREE